jgi:transposase
VLISINCRYLTEDMSNMFKEYGFLNYYKQNRSKKYIYRCLGCYYIQQGKSYDEVSILMQYNRNSIIEWVKNFKSGGIEGLLSIKSGRGRKAKIGTELKNQFCQKVTDLQDQRSGGRIIAKDIVAMAEKAFGKSYSISGMYSLLKRMNMSWVSGRSIHPKTNTEAQETFKKTLERK